MTRVDHDETVVVDSRDALWRRLLWLAWEVPCYGLALWTLLRVNTARFGGPEIITVVGFLVFFVVSRLLTRPIDRIRRGPGYALAVLETVP